MSAVKVYSLKSCDTCKKALKWLAAQGIAHTVQDVRADGISRDEISQIVTTLGWEQAVNRRSTTWRNLDDTAKAGLDNDKAIELIAEQPTLMKRPVIIDDAGQMSVGFTAAVQTQLKG